MKRNDRIVLSAFVQQQSTAIYSDASYRKMDGRMSDGNSERTIDKFSEDIEASYERISQIKSLSESEIRYYYDEFSISNSYNSNAIEGNTFTYDETRMLLKEGITSANRNMKEHNEIVGYKKAFDLLYDIVKGSADMTEDLIKRIHSFVMLGDESAGRYRDIQNYIGDMFSVAFTPCAPKVIEKAMFDYIITVNENIRKIRSNRDPGTMDWKDVFRMLARDHMSFERIHPFIDGNGRTGRLILIFEMMSAGLLPIDIRYDVRAQYYSAFKEFEKKIEYVSHPEDKMARLMMDCELRSMDAWIRIFDSESSDRSEHDV